MHAGDLPAAERPGPENHENLRGRLRKADREIQRLRLKLKRAELLLEELALNTLRHGFAAGGTPELIVTAWHDGLRCGLDLEDRRALRAFEKAGGLAAPHARHPAASPPRHRLLPPSSPLRRLG